MTKICVYANFAYMRGKFCIRQQKYFLLRVHMAFKDQQNLSKVEILLHKSNSYFLELRTGLNILIWILQVSKLLLGESTLICYHAYVIIDHRQIIFRPPSKQGYVAS